MNSEVHAVKLDTFLFDLGGVLVNDLDLNYDTSIRIFKMLGKRGFTKEEYLANLMPIQNLYKFVGLNEEESRESERLFKQFMIRGLDSIVIQPDAKPTLETLKERGFEARVGYSISPRSRGWTSIPDWHSHIFRHCRWL